MTLALSLNGLAKKALLCNGEIEASFIPYSTMKTQLVWQAMNAITPSDNWDDIQGTFVLVYGTLANIQATSETLSLEAQGMIAWWDNCGGDYAHNYELFLMLAAVSVRAELFDAYTQTRAELPKAPEILHQGRPDGEIDPNVLRAGEKRLRKKSSR